MAYTKLHQSLITSTIWREPNHVRIAWVTMMAMADKDGEVMASIPGLADMCRISLQECEEALQCFLSPDPYSRTKDYDGRRIEKIDGGWFLLNQPKYREMASREDSKKRASERTARYRARKASQSVDGDGQSTHEPDIAEAEAEADTKRSNTSPPPKRGVRGGIDEFDDAPPEPPPNDTNVTHDRILPKNWARMTKSDQKTTKVFRNNPTMQQIGSWFGRKPETLWTVAETATLLRIKPEPPEIAGMGKYYEAEIQPEENIRRRDLITLLNNWQGELDRARAFCMKNQ